jgi:hypothetical protein
MPDPHRPSSAPLSEADADRLSERFTASWDEPEPVAPPVAAPLAPPRAPVSPASPGAGPPTAAFGQTAPLPVVQAKAPTAPAVAPAALRPAAAAVAPTPAPPAPLTKPKQTLLGIAPIVVVGPSEPPPAKPTAAPPLSAPPPSSAEVTSSPTATAVTTPSKPYVPKDHPATPAVVISGDVIGAEAPTASTRPQEDRARIAQTIPGQTRSNPMAAPASLPAHAIAASAKPALSTLDDTYPPIKQRGSKLPWVIGGLALVAAAGIAVTKLGVGPSAETAEATRSPVASPEAPVTASPSTEAAPPAAATPAEPPLPSAPSEPATTNDSKRPAAVAAPTPEPPAKKTKATRKVSAAPATRRTVARPEPKPASAPATEPAPTPKPAKGVIVRETPF